MIGGNRPRKAGVTLLLEKEVSAGKDRRSAN